MKISYLVSSHNETKTLSNLLDRLVLSVCNQDEIIVLDDFSDNDETKAILSNYPNIKVIQHNLDNDYGSHKNFGNRTCTGEWIFQIDGDELPPETLLGSNLKDIIESNPSVELMFVPRINDFKGVREEHAKQWGWRLTPSSTCNNRPIINWPDYQGRIYKNIPDRVKWDRRLHERIEGHKEYSFLPDDEDYALYHDKTIEKQIETNVRYNKMFSEAENRGHKVS